MFQGILIVRVNLNRKIILGINKFNQDRKILKALTILPKYLFSLGLNILPKGLSQVSASTSPGHSFP